MQTQKWNPADYSSNSSAQYKFAMETIAKLNLKGDEKLLDIGCGDGKITALLASKLPDGSATGCDSSEAMIEFARKNHPAETHPNLKFIILDAGKISFKNDFDVIFSNAALHWVQSSHAALMKKIFNALRSGGHIMLQMGGEGNAEAVFSAGGQVLRKAKWKDYFKGFKKPWHFPSDTEYMEYIDACGFTNARVELIPKTMEQDGIAGLSSWIRTTWLPYLERLPENLRETFISETTETYISDFPASSDGKISVNMMRLEVEAFKK